MTTQRYTQAELVTQAHAAGYPQVKGRLVASWVNLGLIDESVRAPGRGRAGGVPRYWSPHQKDLFLQLLKNKEGGVRRTATLCNIPVAWWLYRGDPFVPLRQTKRVLETWFDKTEHASWQRSTHSAEELMAAFLPNLPPGVHDKILTEIANITYAGRFDAQTLRARLRSLGDASNEVTGDGQTFYLTDLAVGQIEAVLYAREHLDEETPDDLYRFARTKLVEAGSRYAADQPQLAETPDIGHLATPFAPNQLGDRACAYLAQLLGHFLLAGDKPQHPPSGDAAAS